MSLPVEATATSTNGTGMMRNAYIVNELNCSAQAWPLPLSFICPFAVMCMSSVPPTEMRPHRKVLKPSIGVLVQIGKQVQKFLIWRIPYRLNNAAVHTAGAAAFSRTELREIELDLANAMRQFDA
jgi:hypothetical protein